MGPEALLREKIKQKRHREGYEDGLSSSHKMASALSFILSDAPVEMLGQFTRLVLDGPDSWQVSDLAYRIGEEQLARLLYASILLYYIADSCMHSCTADAPF